MIEMDTNTILEERGCVAAGHVQGLNSHTSMASHSHTGEFLIYISVCESSKIKSAESDFSTAYYE